MPERRIRPVELPGAVVVVTGASSGFGELAAERFARAGSSVVLAARRLERLESLEERIRSAGGSALAVRCDVADRAQLEALRDRVADAFGRCDALVNNAGIRGGGPFETVGLDDLERVIDVNLRAVVLGTKLFLPMMLERGHGHVVNVASLAGRFATPGAAVYGATKHGVVAFSEALYHELGPRGILVTSVNPGFSPTEGFPKVGPSVVRIDPHQVAKLIVDVVRRGRAPEVSIPRTLAALQAFRVLTPPLYRWGVRTISRRVRSSRE
jgi:NADP-dependent 3-hydroxy acid dehydrogenase YdfG